MLENGDRVIFKSLEKLIAEFGEPDINGDINVGGCYFRKDMRHLCGTLATVAIVREPYVLLEDFSVRGRVKVDYSYVVGMLQKV